MKDQDLKQRLLSVARAQKYWQEEGWRIGDPLFEDRMFDLLAQVKLAALEDPIDPQSMPRLKPVGKVFSRDLDWEDVEVYQNAELERMGALKLAREQAGQEDEPEARGTQTAALERKTQVIGQYIVEHGGFQGPQAEALRGLSEWMGRSSEGILNLDYNGLPIPFDYYFFLDLTDKLCEPARQVDLEKIVGAPTP